jgi:CRISPR-associated endoribonuclease Cas6
MQYHYHLQGYIYNLLKGSKYDYVHDREGYKFFCFSNIFPASDLAKDDTRTLLISSPDSGLIDYLHGVLQKPWNQYAMIGKMKFKMESVEEFAVSPPENYLISVITGTPIIIRISRETMQKNGIEAKGKYPYIYWRNNYPVGIFINHLTNNLLNKYAEFSRSDESKGFTLLDEQLENKPIFDQFVFKKQISTRVFLKGFEQVVIGTVWQFRFSPSTDRDLIHFAMDAGLGERNSLGFGFMNLLSNK